MRRLFHRVRRAVTTGWNVARLEWRNEWTPALRDLSALLQTEIARQQAAGAAVGSLRERPFFETLVADVNPLLDHVTAICDHAELEGLSWVMEECDRQVGSVVTTAKASEFLLAYQVAMWAVVFGMAAERTGATAWPVATMASPTDGADRVH